MPDREKVITALAICTGKCKCVGCWYGQNNPDFRCQDRLKEDALALLREQKQEPAIVRCKDCKHWDITTRKEGNDCILGPWEDAVCDMLRDWDTYGDLGESFRRTNGDWFCADGERR